MATAKKLPSGAYRCLIFDRMEDGKRKYKSFTAPTKKEAEYNATQYIMTKEEKKKALPECTLYTAIDNYCNLKSNVLSPSTLKEYRRAQNYNYAAIKDIKISEITNGDIQQWVNDFSISHSPKTVKNAYGLIRAVLDTFAPDIHLRVTLPQSIPHQLYVPSDNDIKALLKYFSENDTDMELAVYLAAFGTLRRSEICALTADDVSGNIISVSKAMVTKGNSNWVIKTTKTVSSTRFIEMPDFVVDKFPKSGKIININPDQITRRFERVFPKLGIKSFRFHDLRHYAASIMHAIGVPDQYIMQRGGWSSDKTLKAIYRGTIEEYTQKYTNMTLLHFDNMQHEMQHEIEKA
ncbi:site-specific integrase [Lachnospiraceae bacterium MD335]|nr:site-specific integrase [Lachnospiraceae bacterium MD335]